MWKRAKKVLSESSAQTASPWTALWSVALVFRLMDLQGGTAEFPLIANKQSEKRNVFILDWCRTRQTRLVEPQLQCAIILRDLVQKSPVSANIMYIMCLFLWLVPRNTSTFSPAYLGSSAWILTSVTPYNLEPHACCLFVFRALTASWRGVLFSQLWQEMLKSGPPYSK